MTDFIRIKASRPTFRRAGLLFGSADWVEVATFDLSPAQALALLEEPVLMIEIKDGDGWKALGAEDRAEFVERLRALTGEATDASAPTTLNASQAAEISQAVLRLDGAADTLLGSSTFPAMVEIVPGVEISLGHIPLGELVLAAFKASGLTADEWNALDEDLRDLALGETRDRLRQESIASQTRPAAPAAAPQPPAPEQSAAPTAAPTAAPAKPATPRKAATPKKAKPAQ